MLKTARDAWREITSRDFWRAFRHYWSAPQIAARMNAFADRLERRGKHRLTAEEFERAYAERSGMTVDELRALDRVVRPCDCDSDLCEGWQSVSREHAAEIDDPSIPWVR